jgi:hypothetical protein
MAGTARRPGILPPNGIVGICRIYNDGDVIFANLSRLADYGIRKFILSDMRSTDNSRAEIERFIKTYKNSTVFVIDDPGREILGSKIATGLSAFAASALDAIWILPFDPDDFLWISPQITVDLTEGDIDYIRLPWLQVHPKCLEGGTIKEWLDREHLDHVVKLNVSPGKVIVRWRADLVIERGHHWLHSKSGRVLKGIRGDDIGAAMTHIPMRSPQQLLEKMKLQAEAEKIVRGEFHKTLYSTIAVMLARNQTDWLVALIEAIWRRDQLGFGALCAEQSIDPQQFGYLADLVFNDPFNFRPPDGANWLAINKAPRMFTYRRKDSAKPQRVGMATRMHAAMLRMQGYVRAS